MVLGLQMATLALKVHTADPCPLVRPFAQRQTSSSTLNSAILRRTHLRLCPSQAMRVPGSPVAITTCTAYQVATEHRPVIMASRMPHPRDTQRCLSSLAAGTKERISRGAEQEGTMFRNSDSVQDHEYPTSHRADRTPESSNDNPAGLHPRRSDGRVHLSDDRSPTYSGYKGGSFGDEQQ